MIMIAMMILMMMIMIIVLMAMMIMMVMLMITAILIMAGNWACMMRWSRGYVRDTSHIIDAVVKSVMNQIEWG